MTQSMTVGGQRHLLSFMELGMYSKCGMQCLSHQTLIGRPVGYCNNIVYHDIFSNIAIRYFLLDIVITAIEI